MVVIRDLRWLERWSTWSVVIEEVVGGGRSVGRWLLSVLGGNMLTLK